LRTASGLQALLGFLAVIAVRLLHLRTLSREAPDQSAQTVIPELLLRVVSARLKKPPSQVSVGQFWRAVAGLGGFLGRKGDGSPGWQTLWRGWLRLQDMVWGAEMALGINEKCG
jgi:hypothetical protein